MVSKLENCPLCSGAGFHTLFVKNGIDIVACKRCGFVFSDFAVQGQSADFFKNFYNLSYFSGEQKTCGTDSFGYDENYFSGKRAEKSHIAGSELKQIEKLKPEKGKLLEIGCAAGYFLRVARDRGWNAFGLELSDAAAEFGRKQLGLDIETGTIETTRYPNESFDVIVGMDVIEHVPDPHIFVKRAGELLKENGLLMVATPNVASLAAWLRKSKWPHFRPPEHLHYFAPKTIAYLISPHFARVIARPSKVYHARLKMATKDVLKRILYICFNNFSFIIGKGEYLKAYAWK
jgi:2-polyprenyl-3-methyl-5-hydroxy-6-metoxy-1,4-benzoquinol methylase